MKHCSERTLKGYITKWNKALNDAYRREFEANMENGFFGASSKQMTISVLKGLIARAMNGDSVISFETDMDGQYTGEMLIRDIPGMYELGSDYDRSRVQAVLRGLNCNHRDIVYTAICFDLNSATIYDMKELVARVAA